MNPGHDSRDLNACIRAATADCLDVVELGCMFGDRLALCAAATRIGIDAHAPYIEEAKRRHPDMADDFIVADGREYLRRFDSKAFQFDGILLVDFLEHLTAADAVALIEIAKRRAHRVVLFVPLGAHPQTADVFNMGGDHWQTHRSTWEPADLEALGFDVAVWDGYHHQPGKDSRAAFCVWEPR